ncbi:MAG TPA: hypothetical protein VFB58_01625 [Chloroflexota bacterium]|nr:hypothetical protein [Chloroflexota bacterium]
MLDSLIQQFAGGGHESMGSEQAQTGVSQMLQAAPNEHGIGAIADALGTLGAGGFGRSVQQGAASASPPQRNALVDTLLNAVAGGGGSPNRVRSQLGIGGSSVTPQELGTLAEYVGANHSDALAREMGTQVGSGQHGGLVSLLGDPMVRQIGVSLAKRML